MPPFDRPAIHEDLLSLPDNVVGEIIDGELHATPRAVPGLAGTATALGGMLLRGLERSAGSAACQILPGAELRLGPDVLVPGLAAWKSSRLRELPATAYFSIPPDWVCEILSSYPAALRARKMAIYAREGVSHAWLIDPVAHALEVRRLEDGRWTIASTYVGDQPVRAEPFEDIELQFSVLWPPEPDPRRQRRH